jgi:hypothetical protein
MTVWTPAPKPPTIQYLMNWEIFIASRAQAMFYLVRA